MYKGHSEAQAMLQIHIYKPQQMQAAVGKACHKPDKQLACDRCARPLPQTAKPTQLPMHAIVLKNHKVGHLCTHTLCDRRHTQGDEAASFTLACATPAHSSNRCCPDESSNNAPRIRGPLLQHYRVLCCLMQQGTLTHPVLQQRSHSCQLSKLHQVKMLQAIEYQLAYLSMGCATGRRAAACPKHTHTPTKRCFPLPTRSLHSLCSCCHRFKPTKHNGEKPASSLSVFSMPQATSAKHQKLMRPPPPKLLHTHSAIPSNRSPSHTLPQGTVQSPHPSPCPRRAPPLPRSCCATQATTGTQVVSAAAAAIAACAATPCCQQQQQLPLLLPSYPPSTAMMTACGSPPFSANSSRAVPRGSSSTSPG